VEPDRRGLVFEWSSPCLAAAGTEVVRSDRRRVELGVISVREPGGPDYRVAVVVHCLA